MPIAARLGDIASPHGCFPPTPIIAGSGDVFINGIPAARLGDAAAPHGCPCPKIPHNGMPAARVGDAIGCGGVVATGSPNVIIG